MAVDRLSVALDPELGAAIREAAEAEQTSVSAWLAEAAADRLRNRLLGLALDAWQAEDGPITEAELEAARREVVEALAAAKREAEPNRPAAR